MNEKDLALKEQMGVNKVAKGHFSAMSKNLTAETFELSDSPGTNCSRKTLKGDRPRFQNCAAAAAAAYGLQTIRYGAKKAIDGFPQGPGAVTITPGSPLASDGARQTWT